MFITRQAREGFLFVHFRDQLHNQIIKVKTPGITVQKKELSLPDPLGELKNYKNTGYARLFLGIHILVK